MKGRKKWDNYNSTIKTIKKTNKIVTGVKYNIGNMVNDIAITMYHEGQVLEILG